VYKRQLWARDVDAGQPLDVVFVDFSKASDKVPHQRLLLKLASYGISAKVRRWLQEFLEGRTMRVKVNEELSEGISISSGVPQGSVLGPELFKVYVNDLPQHLATRCLLYADDLKLWKVVTSDEEADQVQYALDRLHAWSLRWMLPINHEKCSLLPVGRPRPAGSYHLGGYIIRESLVERELGVLVTTDLKTMADSKKRATSANKMMWAIRRSFDQMTPGIFLPLFAAHVRPILEYGQPAVCPLTKQEVYLLERVQRRGTKGVAGLKNVPYSERLHRLRLFSLSYRRNRVDLIYTWRILQGNLGGDLKEFFTVVDGSLTRGHELKLYKPRRLRLNPLISLSSRVVNEWNSLPAEVVSASTELNFKNNLDRYMARKTDGCCFLCKSTESERNPMICME
jgi:ribonuclease P/MRP protein subunit RPP40